MILQNGESSEQNIRLVSLLQDFNLENRIWKSGEDIEMIMEQSIDWVSISDIIAKKKLLVNDFFQSVNL